MAADIITNPDIPTVWDSADPIQRAVLLAGALPESKMDKAKHEQLLKVADADAQIKLRILYNAVASGIREYGADSKAANLNNWRSAEKELDKYIGKLREKHFQGERTFPNIPAVIRYLEEQGWKISQATLYNHRKAGKLKPNSTGQFPLSVVERYIIEANLHRIDGSVAQDEASGVDIDRKRRAEAEISEYDARIKKIKAETAEGKYIERYEYERSLAQRAALLKSDIDAFIRGTADEMIRLVDGDPEKTPDLIEHMLNQFQRCLGRYAEEREFAVPSASSASSAKTVEGDNEGEDE
jgi:hypothetical protein